MEDIFEICHTTLKNVPFLVHRLYVWDTLKSLWRLKLPLNPATGF